MNRSVRFYPTVVVAVAGATLIAVTPVATPVPHIQARAIQLTTSGIAESDPSSPLQSAIDQLLQAEQQVEGINADYSFSTPYDQTLLPTYVQNLALTMFAVSLSQQAHTLAVPYAPFAWNANAADPQGFTTLPNPDYIYSPLRVDSHQTYVLTVDPGPGTQQMSLTPNAGNGLTVDFTPLKGSIDLANATPNADGTYTIIFSSTQPPDTPPGDWVDITGADRVILRDAIGDWGQIHDHISLEEVGGPAATGGGLPQLSDDQLASLVSTVAANLVAQNAAGTYFNTQRVIAELPANTFSPIDSTLGNVGKEGDLGSLLPGQVSSAGHFVLEPDQALIVKVPDVDSQYAGIELADIWSQTAPYATAQGSLNNVQAFHDPDGFTYYVISSQDPGVANWLDDSGLKDGEVFLRFPNAQGDIPTTTPIETHVVNVADVHNEIGNLLPADTPLVTPAERAADLQLRLFEYDYAHDQVHGMSWLGNNLMIFQIKDAIGADQYNELFGGQTDVPSVLDRMAPALTPNLATIANDILANPGASLTALGNNLPLAIQDIEMPTALAAIRLLQDVQETVQAVHSDISSGDLSQVLADLGKGVQGLGTIFNDMLTDPATSITAGFLNARDDLAVAIMNASSSTVPSNILWNSLSEVNQALAQAVSHALSPSTAATDFSTLFDPALLGVDLAPNAGGLPLDLLG